MRILLNLVLIFMIFSCKEKVKKNFLILDINQKQEKFVKQDMKIKSDSILQSGITKFGFLVLKNSYNSEQKLVIYNFDGSSWKSFNYNDSFNDNQINPFGFKPETRLLVFKCLKKKNGYFYIVVDEEKNNIKYIKEADKNFEYKTPEEHILSVFSVEFDDILNPLRLTHDDKSEISPTDKNSFYYPIKIDRNWLLVEDDNKRTFWIKWQDKTGNLILKLYYDA